ncbi:MAG: MBL fold metallo-hydrolase [Eubacterium sp.]|nr:MBL fold metallo-hydrolase [Eubacterium sp.]
MNVFVLSDNTGDGAYEGEHGLSLYIEYGKNRILLDAGKSNLFYRNALRMGVDLTTVDYAVLSHSHYDHADGFEKFFEINDKAKLYLRRESGEFFYSQHGDKMRYIGPAKGMLDRYRNRLIYIDEMSIPVGSSGASLLAHSTDGLEKIASRAGLYRMVDKDYIPDDFSHEQTLVFPTEKGLVIFNSCSHAGAANIVHEVTAAYSSGIYAYIGGFHLFESGDEEVLAFIDTLKTVDVQRIITGHCTGDRACELLRDALGNKVEKMHAGLVMEI